MAPYVRGLLFFASLLCAPFLYALGHRLGGDLPAALLSGALVLATFASMSLGGTEPMAEAPDAPASGPHPGTGANASAPTGYPCEPTRDSNDSAGTAGLRQKPWP